MHRIHRLEVAGVVAASLLVGFPLLVGFQSVVRQSVRQGESRRDTVSRLAQASAACTRIPPRAEREACRARMSTDAEAAVAGRQQR